jgi:crotonobetaine/carnitine-CoA ligase
MAFLFGAVLHQAPESPDDAANPLRVGFMAPLIAEYEAFAQRFGIEVRSLFGMTELGVGLVSDGRIVDPRSCGRPIRGVAGLDVRLVDEHDNEVPVGEVGELVDRTSVPWTLNAGYFEMPEATARAWRNGWFHTGDGFRRDEAGDYYFVDRLKDYIRRRGENISAFDLERVVNQHPAVLESAAIAAPSETSEDEVKIVVVRRPGATLTAEGLVGFLLPRLPVFMVPRYIELVEELPRTPTMKVRKVDLRATALNSATWDRRSGAFLGLAAGPPQREGEAVSRAARVEGLVLGG